MGDLPRGWIGDLEKRVHNKEREESGGLVRRGCDWGQRREQCDRESERCPRTLFSPHGWAGDTLAAERIKCWK
jgi:hypothetical protein